MKLLGYILMAAGLAVTYFSYLHSEAVRTQGYPISEFEKSPGTVASQNPPAPSPGVPTGTEPMMNRKANLIFQVGAVTGGTVFVVGLIVVITSAVQGARRKRWQMLRRWGQV